MALDFPNPPLTVGQTYTASNSVTYHWDGAVWAPPTIQPPAGAAGGDLTGSYPNPTLAAGAVSTADLADAPNGVTTAKLNDGAVTNVKIADVAWGKVTGAPSSFPPSGAAGGDLTGTYPNPTVAAGAVGNAEISDVAWAKVTGAPTSLPPSGTAGGDLTGTYPNPTVTAAAKSKWTDSGATLTPTDTTKGLSLPTTSIDQLTLGSPIKVQLYENAAGLFQIALNTSYGPQDTAKSSWHLQMDATNDFFKLFRRAPGGAVGAPTTLLTVDSGGTLRLPSASAGATDVVVWGNTGTATKGHLAALFTGSTAWLSNSTVNNVTDEATAPPWQINLGYTDKCTVSRSPAGATASFASMAEVLSGGNFTIYGATAQKASGTTWSNPSDPRLKDDIAPYAAGLAEICQLKPLRYRLKADPTRECYGFDASKVQDVFPECVSTTRMKLDPADEQETDNVLTFDMHPILVAMTTALQELAQRVAALEARG